MYGRRMLMTKPPVARLSIKPFLISFFLKLLALPFSTACEVLTYGLKICPFDFEVQKSIIIMLDGKPVEAFITRIKKEKQRHLMLLLTSNAILYRRKTRNKCLSNCQ